MICILMATKIEADPFIEGLQLEKIENRFFHIYRNHEVILFRTGVGKMNTAMAATYAITEFSPRRVLNLGAAGSLSNAPLGTVFQIHSIIESDRPIRHLNKERIYTPQTLSGFDNAVLASQDIPLLAPDKRNKVALSADLVDMEGCAVAHVCKRFSKDLYLYKFVTDNMVHHKLSDIVENIEKYSPSFYTFCHEMVLPVHYRSSLRGGKP